MTALDPEVRILALSFSEQLLEIEDAFVGRREAVHLLGVGALCQEHVLLLGPPGTAKTRLVERFCRMLDTRPFSYLLTRFTEPAEIFGPIDVKVLGSDIAVSQGTLTEEQSGVTDAGPAKAYAYMDVWVRRGGEWVVVRSQAAKLTAPAVAHPPA